MSGRRTAALLALLSPIITACAAPPLAHEARPAPANRATPARPAPERLARDGSAVPPASAPEPSGTVTLRDALAAALRDSPDLAATAYAVRAREADALQAARLPNPELAVEFENFGGSGAFKGAEALETTLALSQLVELGGKRAQRRRVAEHEARLATWDHEIRRIDVLARTAADFIRLLAAERHHANAAEMHELADRVSEAVGARVEAGKISPVERTKADIELARAELADEQATRAVAAARSRLAANWGSATPQFTSATGDLDSTPPPPSLEALLALVEESPDIARWATEAAARQAEVELALARRVPDFTVTGGVRWFEETDDLAFVAGIALPLPVFDRNDDAVRAVRLRSLALEQREVAARIRAQATITASFHGLQSAFVAARTMNDRVLPNAELAFAAAEEAFRQGKIGAIDLLDAERTLFEARRDSTDALITYHLAVIAAERLIGAPLRNGVPARENAP